MTNIYKTYNIPLDPITTIDNTPAHTPPLLLHESLNVQSSYSLPPSPSPSPPSGSSRPLLSSPLLPLSLSPSLPPSVSSELGAAAAENRNDTGCSLMPSLGVSGLDGLQLAPGRAGLA